MVRPLCLLHIKTIIAHLHQINAIVKKNKVMQLFKIFYNLFLKRNTPGKKIIQMNQTKNSKVDNEVFINNLNTTVALADFNI